MTEELRQKIEQLHAEALRAYENGDPTAWGWFMQDLEKIIAAEKQEIVNGIVKKLYHYWEFGTSYEPLSEIIEQIGKEFYFPPSPVGEGTEENIDSRGNCKFCGMPREMIEEGHWNPGKHKKPCSCNCHPSISNPHPQLDNPNRAMECEHCRPVEERSLGK